SYHYQNVYPSSDTYTIPSEAEVDRLLVIPSLPQSPPTSLSFPLPQIPLPSFPIPSPPTNSPTYTEAPLGYKAAEIRADVPDVVFPPRKRLYIAPGPRYKIKESSFAPTARSTGGFRAYYGFVSTLDAEIRRDPYRKIGYGITDVSADSIVLPFESTMSSAKSVPLRAMPVILGLQPTNFQSQSVVLKP
nr:hypothetical protein [Tanacetum cinerariifolium]